MKRPLLLALGLAAVTAANVHAQLTNVPVYSLPSTGEAPVTYVVGGWGRGLNDNSGKLNAFYGGVGRTGLGGSITASARVGYADLGAESKINFGVNGAVDVLPAGSTTQVAVQVGIGYISLATDFSTMNFPIGVALKTQVAAGSGTLTPWIMPRVHMFRLSTPLVDATETEFGASAGATWASAGGFGLAAALDWLAIEGAAPILFGVAVSYRFP